jgi:DNA-binding CsgD family transcriptional regulator/tetratricopeptide (TPR) repeat protein
MSRLGPLLCPILVGRDDLLELADRRLAEVVAGHGQFLLLAGEAGIGKSRFLAAVERKAQSRGFRITGGYVAPQDRAVPAASLLDLARNMARIDSFADLGRELLRRGGEAAVAERPQRRMLVLDLVDLIAGAVTRPTMLAFEDLQWADDLSLEVLTELARRTQDQPLLLVGAYRMDELGPGAILREWRSRLLTQRMAEEARLAPLTLEQTGLMTTLILSTGLPAPREVVAAVYERTDGIPLHIEELLGVIGDDARSDSRAIRDAAVPDTIEDAIRQRVGQLSTDAQAVARAGAVIGRCFVPEVLAGIMDLPIEALDAPLEELVEQGVLDPPGLRGLYDYRHQLLRDVLYAIVPERERRRLHARAAEFGAQLEGASEVHASVHFERAGLRAQAFRAASSGARTAAKLSSHREAFELYRRAIENMPADLDPAEQGALYEAYGDEAAAIEIHDVVEEASLTARKCFFEAGRPVDAARQLAALAAVARREARPIEARLGQIALGLSELEPLPLTPERELARYLLLVERASAQIDTMDLEGAGDAVVAADGAARAAGDPAAVIFVDSIGGMVDVLRGDVDRGLARIDSAARKARDAGYEDVGVTAYRNAVTTGARVMAYRSAESSLREGMRYADAIEQSHCRHVMGATAALVAWAGGRWDDAIATGEQELANRGCSRGTLVAQVALGYVALGRGELDRAQPLLEEAVALGEASGAVDLLLPPLWGLAEAAVLAGNPGQAAARCDTAYRVSVAAGERSLLVPFLVTGMRALLAGGRPDEAERWLVQLTEHLGEESPVARPAIDHARGLQGLAAGTLGLAREALEAAILGWDDRGRVWEASWARLDLAGCLLRAHRFGDAVPLLRDVRSTAAGLGSGPLEARVDELTRLARGRGFEEDPWRPLTAREVEVARLIAAGMTNGQIAAELDIAPKTASAHVEHILAKLGVMRRAEIAAWLATVSPDTNGSRAPEAALSARR